MRLENWIGNEDGKLWSTCSVCQAPYQCVGVPLLTLIFAMSTFVTPSAGISDSGGQLYSWSVGYEFGLLPCDLQGMNDIHDMYKVAKYGCGQQLRSEAFINTCSVVAWLCGRLWGLLVVGWHSGACRSSYQPSLGSIPSNCWVFTFLYFCLIKAKKMSVLTKSA